MPDEPSLVLSSPPELPPTEEETALSDSANTEPAAEETSAPPEDSDYIRINPKAISQDLSRLLRDDPEFARVFNSHVGQKARSKYESTLQEKDLTIERLTHQLRSLQFSGLAPDDIASRIQADPQFAADYVAYRNSPPPNESQENILIRRTIDSAFNSALDAGVPVERIQYLEQQLQSGFYDKDSAGNLLSLADGLAQLQRDIYKELSNTTVPVTSPAAARPSNPTSNVAPVRDAAAPDLSGTNRGGTAGAKIDISEIKRWTPDQMLQHFPNEGDLERAIQAGRVTGLSPELADYYGVKG